MEKGVRYYPFFFLFSINNISLYLTKKYIFKMKNLIFSLVVILGLLSTQTAHSQAVVNSMTTSTSSTVLSEAGSDTLTNSDTLYLSSVAIPSKKEISIMAGYKRISGTVTGFAHLFVSLDGTNYMAYTSAVANDTMAMATPITMNGITGKTYTWKIPVNYWKHFKVMMVTNGTSVIKCFGTSKNQ